MALEPPHLGHELVAGAREQRRANAVSSAQLRVAEAAQGVEEGLACGPRPAGVEARGGVEAIAGWKSDVDRPAVEHRRLRAGDRCASGISHAWSTNWYSTRGRSLVPVARIVLGAPAEAPRARRRARSRPCRVLLLEDARPRRRHRERGTSPRSGTAQSSIRESRPPLSGHRSSPRAGRACRAARSTHASAPASRRRSRLDLRPWPRRRWSIRARPSRRPRAACGRRRRISANGVRSPSG